MSSLTPDPTEGRLVEGRPMLVGILAFIMPVLILAAIILFAWQNNLGQWSAPHLYRNLVLIVLGSTSVVVGLVNGAKRRWLFCVSWILGGLAGAGLTWWFFPCREGISYWQARQSIRAPASERDLEVYSRQQTSNQSILRLYPSLEREAAKQAQAWLRSIVTEKVAESNEKSRTDPQAASVDLQSFSQRLAPMADYSLVKHDLLGARQRAATAILNAGKRKCRDLLIEQKYAAAAASASELVKSLTSEAVDVGLESELKEFREGYHFIGRLAERAAKGGGKP